ncbi:MAG: helix-turn-helix domain-containing protein [Pirellula sp.]|nr:helix-turn-helix domain-containing protein [Pirellula sp.]
MSKKQMKPKRVAIDVTLREAIQAYGTAYALSKESGVSEPVISRFVRGERTITLDTAAKLCKALGLSLKKD